jgi:lactose/L-arabinose transport system substrate-binding protein
MNRYPKSWLDISDVVKPVASKMASVTLSFIRKSGSYYAIPWDIGPCALYYRKDYFKAAGVSPSSIKTWDDFISVAPKVESAAGTNAKMIGFDENATGSADTYLILFNELGGQFYNKEGKVNFNTPKMHQALAMMKKFISSGIAMDLPSEWNDRLTAMEGNKLLTVPYANWFAAQMEYSLADQKGKWGVMNLPAFTAGGNQQAIDGGSVLALTTSSNVISLNTGGLFSAYKPAYSIAAYKKTNKYFGISMGTFFSKASTKIPALNYGSYYTDVTNALNTAIASVIGSKVGVSKALKAASSAANAAIAAE